MFAICFSLLSLTEKKGTKKQQAQRCRGESAMKKGNRAHSISRPAGSSARTHNQPDTWTKKRKEAQPTWETHDWQQSSPLSITDSFRFSSFWPRAFVVLLVCFVSLGVVLVSTLSGLLDSARSGCPLLAGDEWSFSLLFRFWLCCRGFL